MSLIRKLLDYSETALAASCVAALAVMVVLGVATVVFRFVVESSLAFPDELIRYLFVWVIFLGAAIALRRNAHAAIGILVDRLTPGWRRPVVLASTAVSGAFFLVLLTKGTELSLRVIPQISPALEVSMAWVYAAVPVSAAIMLAYTVEIFLRQATAPASDLGSVGR